ncbi:hypothetical protein [Persephonella sp. KM09-Lau-8]|uniref:hypothetical protein n=1 Tax=Persephonella sp. KM09-Lau-8 TaxID=1158345 RepID=UPI000496D6C2|nr:hypothetical protein [Persephonella sp. KM09-Lau-8]
MKNFKNELKDIENKLFKEIKKLIDKENIIKPEYAELLKQKRVLEEIKIYKSTYKKKVEIKGKKYEYKPLQLHAILKKSEKTITIAHVQSRKSKEKLNRLYKLIRAYQTIRRVEKELKEVENIKKLLKEV